MERIYPVQGSKARSKDHGGYKETAFPREYTSRMKVRLDTTQCWKVTRGQIACVPFEMPAQQANEEHHGSIERLCRNPAHGHSLNYSPKETLKKKAVGDSLLIVSQGLNTISGYQAWRVP